MEKIIINLNNFFFQTYPLFPNLPQWLWLALFEHHSKQELLPFPFHHCTKMRFDEFLYGQNLYFFILKTVAGFKIVSLSQFLPISNIFLPIKFMYTCNKYVGAKN